MAKAQTQTGGKAMRAVFEDGSRRAAELKELLAPDPDPNLPREGMKAGQWDGFPHDCMPPGCCVEVVGRDADGVVYAIGTTGYLRRMEKFDQQALSTLFAPKINSLMFWWPAWGEVEITDDDGAKKKVLMVKRTEVQKCMNAMINEAARKPEFDPNLQHRGTGGWADKNGDFVWHSGGYLWRVEGKKLTCMRPRLYAGYLYTRQAQTVEPWQEPVDTGESPAIRILDYLRSWNWQRPWLDPLLVMGWIGVALMGGALKARPILFTTGGAGVGKSTLIELLKGALGAAQLTTVNTTAAGIYQRVKRDATAFLIDELESKPGSTRAESVIELMRVAYTGGDISRGGQDHEATTFTARNAFAGFAINAPPMGTQDKSRMAVVNLSPLDKANGIGPQKMKLSPDTDPRMLLRQIMDGWRDFNDRLLPNYWEALAPHGMDSRAIDTFGTLLAACELLVGPAVMEDVGLPVTEFNRLGELIGDATALERAERMDNWHACLDHLLQSSIEAWRDGVKPTVGGVCDGLTNGRAYPEGLMPAEARQRLQLVGLSVVEKDKFGPGTGGPYLAVPADGPVLRRIFAETDWLKGVWFSALKQAPAGVVVRGRDNVVKINGSAKRCLLVDLAAFDEWARKL